MFEKAIQKLKNEKAKLCSEAKQTDAEYKNEVKRIDTAIKKFEEGMAALITKNTPHHGVLLIIRLSKTCFMKP